MIVDDFIAQARWVFAKTMPQWPHWYTLRGWNDYKEFMAFCHLIRSTGVYQKKTHWTRMYLDFGDYYYWTMSKDIENTTLINRALQ